LQLPVRNNNTGENLITQLPIALCVAVTGNS